jgi:hypothetical protein
MKFDINEVIAEMSVAVKDVIGENWNEVLAVTNQFLQNRKERLELLAELRISGDISKKRFESRLKDETLIAEAEFHAIAVISKAIAQKAANAAMEVLENAVKTAINIAK